MPKFLVVGSYPVLEEVAFEVEAESLEALEAMGQGKGSELLDLMVKATNSGKAETSYEVFDENYGTDWTLYSQSGDDASYEQVGEIEH